MAITHFKEGSFGIISGTPYACLEELRSQGIYNSSKVISIAPPSNVSSKDILVMYWHGGQKVLSNLLHWFKFNETSGSTCYDVGSLSKNATLVSGATQTSGMNSVLSGSGAILLSGGSGIPYNVSGCAVISGVSGLITSNGTISVWIYPTTGAAGVNKEQVIYEIVPDYTNSTYFAHSEKCYMRIFLDEWSKAKFDWRNYTTTPGVDYIAISGASVNINAWNHIAVTSDGSHDVLYVNGVKMVEGTNATLSGSNTGQWIHDLSLSGVFSQNIGAHLVSGIIGSYFSGKIDNLRIANFAFTPSEVAQIYDAEM